MVFAKLFFTSCITFAHCLTLPTISTEGRERARERGCIEPDALSVNESRHGGSPLSMKREDHSAHQCIEKYALSVNEIRDGLGTDHIRQLAGSLSSTPRTLGTARSNRSIIFGAGSGTTGTHSLDLALATMGLHGWHWMDGPNLLKSKEHYAWTWQLLDTLGNFKYTQNTSYTKKPLNKRECRHGLRVYDYASLPSDVSYVLDEPVDALLIHLLSTFPNAKFIMTTRPSLEWAQSRRKHMRKTLAPLQDPCGYHIEDFPDDHVLAQLEDAKVQFARCIVPKHRLLEFSVFTDSDERIRGLVQEIGAFVGQPVAADRKLPGSRLLEIHGNTSFEFDTEEMLRSSAAVHIHPDQMYTASELGVLMRELAYYE
eukprot:gnl/TRDRNA2_/TRDRNA2_82990_c0_seq4.p1 gnl/TRDRNA2_/TRDRNA2_82990_c0~~gnl/TRDRNA2_/TRDRNA2_82990_c0_seq4.p1  ORF type:complete len:370 (+),score=18.67 gnl/TRDRNA2_/TRDRNA2_82990_c0_seq4:102-1211(+)